MQLSSQQKHSAFLHSPLHPQRQSSYSSSASFHQTLFRFNWEGGEGEFLIVLVLLLKACFSYGLIIKTAKFFSFVLHVHPISLISQEGAPCLLGWVGLSIGTGFASSSKNADVPCGRVSKPPWEATCKGECDWLSGL